MTPYTLTGATDWPMLVASLKMAGWIIAGLISLVCLLIGALWVDLRRQFSSHQIGEEARCKIARDACRAETKRELDALWDTIDLCCPRGDK